MSLLHELNKINEMLNVNLYKANKAGNRRFVSNLCYSNRLYGLREWRKDKKKSKHNFQSQINIQSRYQTLINHSSRFRCLIAANVEIRLLRFLVLTRKYL